MNRVEGKQPVSLVYKDGEFIGEYDWRLCCGNPTADGGIMPQPFDPVPAGRPDALRTSGGTRHMKHGPAHKPADPYEPVPVGGPPAPRNLYKRRDVPWTGTGKGKLFSAPDYTPDPGRPRDIATAPAALPPMRAGRPQLSATSYEHLADPPANAAALFRPALKAGKAPDNFDNGVHKGPAAVPASPPKGPRPKLPRPNTNMRKRDTFGAYPKHISDPFLDDPIKELDDRGRRWAKGKRNVLTCICRGGPTIPIVNVWDHPACLQTKAGVVSGKNPVTGESTTFISDKGRFGSTA